MSRFSGWALDELRTRVWQKRLPSTASRHKFAFPPIVPNLQTAIESAPSTLIIPLPLS